MYLRVFERKTESLREKNEGGLQEKLVCLLVFSHIKGFPRSSVGKESACNAGDLSSIPGLGRSPGEGNGNPLQYSCLENPRDRKPGGLPSLGSHRVGHN